MRRKASRMAGGKLPGCKERGEWAELYFMTMAAGLGMKVLRPFGQVGRYDVGVESRSPDSMGRLLRVQVKSTIYTRRNGGYSLNVMGPQRKKYEPGTVDFFAILLIPIDDWYIIPFEVMGRKNCSIHFTPKSERKKYGEYREAWHLLRRAPGITIQAVWTRTGRRWRRGQQVPPPRLRSGLRPSGFGTEARNDKTYFRFDICFRGGGCGGLLGLLRR